jgi:hypothetical protein
MDPRAAPATAWDRKRTAEAERQRRNASAKREVGEIPPVADLDRREAAAASLLFFMVTYFPELFYLGFSSIHLKVIEKLQKTIIDGDKFSLAMPRGSGKTSIVRAAVIWAAITGRHKYVLLVCGTGVDSDKSLEAIKALMLSSEKLAADFPEVMYPIGKLEGVAQRGRGQTYDGEPTNVVWSKKFVRFPAIAGSAASGAIIDVASLSGHIRGRNITLPDGSAARPTLAVMDDPQTKQSARHPKQTDFRESVILGDVGGLAPPDKALAQIMLCTVICAGDLSDRFLNRTNHPDWRGEKYKLMTSWPTQDKLWDEYRAIRERCFLADESTAAANQFYIEHREEMDEGAVATWLDRFEPGEISAIQYAFNKLYDKGEVEFNSEYQNTPLTQSDSVKAKLDDTAILLKVIGLKRGIVPAYAEKLTCMIDVQERVLFWMVVAWSMDFTGHVVDYGCYPEQAVTSFSARDARKTLRLAHQGVGLEGAIYAGLQTLVETLISRRFECQDEEETMELDRIGIDSGDNTETVYKFYLESDHKKMLNLTKGRGLGPLDKPYTEYEQRKKEVLGTFWIDRPVKTNRAVRLTTFDANEAKNLALKFVQTGKGDRASLTIFKGDFTTHRMLCQHWSAETPHDVTAKNSTRTIWKNEGRLENHHWDTLTGNIVMASRERCSEIIKKVAPKKPKQPRERVSYIDI